MSDQAALQEAIQRARQLAAKIAQNQPVKRPASSAIDHAGPVKVTLAYEKPANSDNNNKHENQPARHRSSSRDHNRNERDPRDSRDSRDRSRDRYGSRERNYGRDSRDRDLSSHRNPSDTRLASPRGPHYESPSGPPQPPSMLRPGGLGVGPIDGGRGGGDDKVELIIPCAAIGLVIGKGGENIKRIQNESGAAVRVDPNPIDEKGNKLCTITGTAGAVEEARQQIESVIENSSNIKRPRMQSTLDGHSDAYRMKIPASRTGAIIGKGGETIKSIKQQSGCDIELDKGARDCGPDESLFILRGSQDQIAKARSLIEQRLAVPRDGRDRGGPRDHHSGDHGSGGRHGGKGVATGANAAPVAPYPDLPTSFPANPGAAAAAAAAAGAGQQNSADMTAAWAAYFAQYSTLFNQTGGGQPGAGGASFPGQPGMMGGLAPGGNQPVAQITQQQQQQRHPQAQAQQVQQPGASGGQTQDYSDQWIEYYLANGRPDYAEQIMQMKKQQTQK